MSTNDDEVIEDGDETNGGEQPKVVEVDGKKFIDDGTGKPKVGEDGEPELYVEKNIIKPIETPEARKARLDRQVEQHKKKHPELYEQKPDEKKSGKKSEELDYGQKAFLSSHDLKIKGAKEFEFVKNEMKSSGQDLESLLENDYFKTRLESFRAANKTEEATPTGKRSNGVPTDSVEYWAAKPIEEVPADMRIKVVNFKLSKEGNKGPFYNSNSK